MPIHKRACPWLVKGPYHVRDSRVIVCGPKDYQDEDVFQRVMDHFLFWLEPWTLVLGGDGCRFWDGGWVYCGVDYLATKYSSCNWGRVMIARGREDPSTKAERVIKHAASDPHCVAFWDGEDQYVRRVVKLFKAEYGKRNLRVVRL